MVRHDVEDLPEPEQVFGVSKIGPRELFRDIGQALTNRNYVMLLIGLFCVVGGARYELAQAVKVVLSVTSASATAPLAHW